MENTSGEPPSNQMLMIFALIRASLGAADIITVIVCAVIIILFIMASAIIASSENAFFSLSKQQVAELTFGHSAMNRAATFLLGNPKKLLATILIANTFVNIAIVMVSGYMFEALFDFGGNHVLGLLLELTLITFTLVLFGEVMPKIYASQNNMQVARLIAVPMYSLSVFFTPLVYLLVRSTSIIDKRITRKGHTLSVDELTHAIDITTEEDTTLQEKTILKSIVNFGNTSVKQIMRMRPDVSAVAEGLPFAELLDIINDWGYSRVPVYRSNLDNVIGILYTKDLLPHVNERNDFAWLSLVRKPYFVPESKKINGLLTDFQLKRVHMAIVVDEFGGTSGIATMEDILEEVFGEINDEFDTDEAPYTRIDENTFVFEARTLINDMARYMEIDPNVFGEMSEADTIAGMLLELSGSLPTQGARLQHGDFTFIVEAADKRRVKRVRVVLNKQKEAVE